MTRSRIWAILAVVIAIVVLWLVFFATGGQEIVDDDVVGDGEPETEIVE